MEQGHDIPHLSVNWGNCVYFLFPPYPQAMATVNLRRKIYSILHGSFSDAGLTEFIRNLIGQRGVNIAFDDLPAIPDVEPWDGKDGEVRGCGLGLC